MVQDEKYPFTSTSVSMLDDTSTNLIIECGPSAACDRYFDMD